MPWWCCLFVWHSCIIQKRFCITLNHNFGWLNDKKAKIWRLYRNLHLVDLWPNSGTLGHFQTWHPPLSFLKHIKIHFEHGCQNVLKHANRIFFQALDGQLLHVSWTYIIICVNVTRVTLLLLETPFDVFADRADPDQAALTRAAWSGSTMFAYGNMIRYDPTLVELTSNFLVLCTNVKFILWISHSGWSLAWIFMKEMVK